MAKKSSTTTGTTVKGPLLSIDGHAASGSPKSIKALSSSIREVMDTAFKNHADQETVRLAIQGLTKTAECSPGSVGATVSGCSLWGTGS